jgi:hypothetical protein
MAVASETMTTPRAMPLIIADRGASADAPEHTIAAFELALDQARRAGLEHSNKSRGILGTFNERFP